MTSKRSSKISRSKARRSAAATPTLSFCARKFPSISARPARRSAATAPSPEHFLIWIPYDEYGGIDGINPATDTLFKEGLVCEADILGSSNKAQADFFLWKDDKFTEEQYRKWFRRRKPCIKGSDSHNVNDELGKLKDHHSKPTDKYCWIKADPTFDWAAANHQRAGGPRLHRPAPA